MASLGITRLEGESDADYERRYCREKMRIYRARKPKSTKKRGKGLRPFKNSDMSHEEWLALRQQPGESDADYKKRYDAAAYKRYAAKHAERLTEKRRATYPKIREKERVRRRKFHAEKPDLVKASQRRYYERNKEKRNAMLKDWARDNPERLAQSKKEWTDAHRGYLNARGSQYRGMRRHATPAWANFDAIRAIYDEAARITRETGIPHAVDHIIPLQGKTVCGLHVENNLRIITKSENSKKRNKLIEALATQGA